MLITKSTPPITNPSKPPPTHWKNPLKTHKKGYAKSVQNEKATNYEESPTKAQTHLKFSKLRTLAN